MEELIKEFDIKIPIETPKANEPAPPGIGLTVWEAAFNGDYDTLERLVDEWNGNKVVLNWQYKDYHYKNNYGMKGTTPLMAACIGNHIKCIILLVNSSGVNVNIMNKSGTALFLATEHGNAEAVEVLLKVKEIDIQEGNDAFGKPLEIAQNKYKIYITTKEIYPPDSEIYKYKEAQVQKYSRIIKLLEKAIKTKEESYDIFSPRAEAPVPLKRRPSNVFSPETLSEKLPTITISIAGHGREYPSTILKKVNNKGEKLDVRVFSAASELNVCGFTFNSVFEKNMDDAVVGAFKRNNEMSSYDIIKEAIQPLSEVYRENAAIDLPIHSGKFSKEYVEGKFNADNTWHTYVPLWNKQYNFADKTRENWIHILNRKNIEGHVFDEDPNKLINLIDSEDASNLYNQQLEACKTYQPKKFFPLYDDDETVFLNEIIDLLSSYGFKVINIIDHSCRVVDTNRYSEEEIKKFHDDEKAQPINRAHGGNTIKRKRKSKKNKRKRKSKKNKK